MEEKLLDFIQSNSPDGGFLQSEYWRKFQDVWGRKTYTLSAEKNNELVAYANIIIHTLPMVGNYFYVPRGPIVNDQRLMINDQYPDEKFRNFLGDLIKLASENNVGWIRIEPASEEILSLIKKNLPKNVKMKKAAVDMQSREILMMDISKRENELLAQMKQKTRYNIRLAEKKGIEIFVSREEKYVGEFLRIVKITAKRDKITMHPENYYRKMLETIPPEILKLYVAEYEGRIVAANLVLFFGRTATYLHGASDNIHRDAMAPHLLQWRQIVDAKKAGCEQYDLGGIKSTNNSWAGITKFKTGFAPDVGPVKFPGSYDIILKSGKYILYRILQKIKKVF